MPLLTLTRLWADYPPRNESSRTCLQKEVIMTRRQRSSIVGSTIQPWPRWLTDEMVGNKYVGSSRVTMTSTRHFQHEVEVFEVRFSSGGPLSAR